MELSRRVTSTRPRRCLKIGAAAVAIMAGVATSVSWALAAATSVDPFGGGSVFSDLQVSAEGQDVGDVWINRAASTDGSGETLRVQINVIDPGQIDESSVCVMDTPFTDRDLGTGGCDGLFSLQEEDAGASASHEIDLGSAFLGEVLYAQVHVTLTGGQLGGTAFGGWLPGDPAFYGNILVPAPVVDAECEEGETGSDANHNGVIDGGECTTIVDAECEEGETGSDANHNGVIDGGECTTIVVATVTPVITDTITPVITDTVTPTIGTSSVVVTNVAPAPVTTSAAPATTSPAPATVLGTLLERAPAPAVAAGDVSTLPRTGLDTDVVLSLAGLLLLLGSALVAASHRSRPVVISG